jgi:hypothetical protein
LFCALFNKSLSRFFLYLIFRSKAPRE